MKKIYWMMTICPMLLGCVGCGASKTDDNSINGAERVEDHFRLAPDSKWLGSYELSFLLGELNDSTQAFVDYLVTIDTDSASFLGCGYKMYFDYRCTMAEQDQKLFVLYDTITEGFWEDKTIGDTIAILTLDGDNYYMESPLVFDDPNAQNVSMHLLTKKEK